MNREVAEEKHAAAQALMAAQRRARNNRLAMRHRAGVNEQVVMERLWRRFHRRVAPTGRSDAALRESFDRALRGVPYATRAAWAGYRRERRMPGFIQHIIDRLSEPPPQRPPPLEGKIMDPPVNSSNAEEHDGEEQDTDN